MENRISLYLDFMYELNNIPLEDKDAGDKSYHYMVTKLEETLNNIDDSISADELKNILTLLQDSDNPLTECYMQIVNILDNN